MSWCIVSDSSCDLPQAAFHSETVCFQSVPLKIQVGEREFIDNDELDVSELLAAMAEERTAAATSCPSPAAFARAFMQGDQIVCFTISENLSGTYNSAVLAREMVLEEHPEKQIFVLDSRSTAGAITLLIRKAQALIESGCSFAELCEQLRLYQAAQRTCFTLENFDNLIKNGRMLPLVGTLLHSLGIHVVAEATPQGTIHVTGKARGEEKTWRTMTSLMRQSKDCTGTEVLIHHCINPEGAVRLRNRILADLPVKSVEILPCRGLTSFYAMERGIIVGF